MTQNNNQNANKVNVFTHGLIKDFDNMVVGEGFWTHARNAVNKTHSGDKSLVGNEPATLHSADASYDIIGLAHKVNSEWVVFSTDEKNSEIGIYNEQRDTYKKLISSLELGFSRKHIITGVCKKNYNDTYSVYWQDGNQPDRFLNLDEIPYKTTGRNLSTDRNCIIEEYTSELDTDKTLLQPYIKIPVVTISKSLESGQLLNGSYQAVVAYSINGVRVTGYYEISNVQPIWSENGAGGSLDIQIDSLDTNFDEFELTLLSTVNGQVTAKRIGFYSIHQSKIVVGYIEPSSVTVPISDILLQNVVYTKSDGMFMLNGYLIRTGVSVYPDFNYQPLANKIRTKWVAVEYPEDYYRKGGNKATYMRDEVYSFFIRWIYKTGQISASYHIPGRKATTKDLQVASGAEVLSGDKQYWRAYNTATRLPSSGKLLDGGLIIAKGDMGYWESSECYPNNKAAIWGENCGKHIRHHKFPDNALIHIHDQGGQHICLLGVEFESIAHPVDETGKPIKDIVGFEILRGSREGNKSILAKGLFNNMGEYNLVENIGDDMSNPDNKNVTDDMIAEGKETSDTNYGKNEDKTWMYDPDYDSIKGAVTEGDKPIAFRTLDTKGLYQNFPFNDVSPNYFLRQNLTPTKVHWSAEDEPLTVFKKDYFSFHSPDTTFRHPYFTAGEVKLYTEEYGSVTGKFEFPYKHPKHKVVTDRSIVLACIVGLGVATVSSMGKVKIKGTFGWDFMVTAKGETERESGLATSPFDTIGSLISINPKMVATTTAGFVMAGASALYYGSLGLNTTLESIYTFGPYRQYALQYNSYGTYTHFGSVAEGNRRRKLKAGKYIKSYIQNFDRDYRINNLYRNEYIAIQTESDIAYPSRADNTRVRLRDLGTHENPVHNEVYRNTSAYYGALKIPFLNQYGQLENVIQIPVDNCIFAADGKEEYSTGILFGGDIYINKYSEKNPYLFFHTWLMGEKDGRDFNYKDYINGPFPRYWANLERYDVGDMSPKVKLKLKKPITITKPSDMYSFDRGTKTGTLFMKNCYFYLSCNGVREFFCESEMNLAYREQGKQAYEMFYGDNFTDVNAMFRSDIITRGNYCKYDDSLSVSKLFNNYIPCAHLLDRDYNPVDKRTFISYFPNKAIYSLQQQSELKKDNWKVFLANNYYDFKDKVTAIKPLNETGAVILFENSEPVTFSGVDQIQTSNGIKYTIGDGGLFSQPLQSIANADNVLEYGSCQSQRGIINTPYGMFFINQAGGKIYQYSGEMHDITKNGMKQWFTEYLPSRLLKAFPDFTLKDNAISGIDCQAIYDPMYELVYFTKKDYKPINGVQYDGENFFIQNGGRKLIVGLDNKTYFEDCSWTISYDPQEQMFLSLHDWHPDLIIPTHTHFVTIKGKGFHKHNQRTDMFSQYYGVNYPWEIEFPINSSLVTTGVKNVEYLLENYIYKNNGKDKLSVVDYNFDRAIVHNDEQNSGLLRLALKPKNDPVASMYATPGREWTDTFYSKEENKYRFNQFFDLTRNYGEFSQNDFQMWITSDNGYIRRLNPQYLDYNKPATERKIFRHYNNKLWLARTISNNVKMLLKSVITKQNPSAR